MRKSLLFAILALVLVPIAASAQGGLYSEPILGANGRPVVGASAQVCTAIGTQGSLCTPTTTVYSNQALSTALTYPLATDSQGNLTFYVAPGLYYLSLYGQGLRTTTRAIAVNCLPGTGCALTGTASALTTASATPATSGVVRFAVGDQMCWRNNANTLNLCLSVNGADALLFAGAAFVQTNIANTFTQNQTFPTIISSTANPASGGWWRLANSDQGCWRNSTNTGNNCLSMSTDRLNYGGGNVPTAAVATTFTLAQTFNGGIAGLGKGTDAFATDSTISAVPVDISGSSLTITTRGGAILVTGSWGCSVTAGDAADYNLKVDGAAQSVIVHNESVTVDTCSFQQMFTGVAAGAHTFILQFLSENGIGVATNAAVVTSTISAIEVSQ